jgi:hypothetical protein
MREIADKCNRNLNRLERPLDTRLTSPAELLKPRRLKPEDVITERKDR